MEGEERLFERSILRESGSRISKLNCEWRFNHVSAS